MFLGRRGEILLPLLLPQDFGRLLGAGAMPQIKVHQILIRHARLIGQIFKILDRVFIDSNGYRFFKEFIIRVFASLHL